MENNYDSVKEKSQSAIYRVPLCHEKIRQGDGGGDNEGDNGGDTGGSTGNSFLGPKAKTHEFGEALGFLLCVDAAPITLLGRGTMWTGHTVYSILLGS